MKLYGDIPGRLKIDQQQYQNLPLGVDSEIHSNFGFESVFDDGEEIGTVCVQGATENEIGSSFGYASAADVVWVATEIDFGGSRDRVSPLLGEALLPRDNWT